MRLIVEQAHNACLPVTAHAHSLVAVEQSIDVGVDCIEHCTCLTDKGVKVSDALVTSIADRDIAISCMIAPTASARGSSASHPKIVAAEGLTAGQIRERRADITRRLHASGVRVITGIDAGLKSVDMAHGNLHIALSLLDEAGFTPAEALAAATSEAARVCRLEHSQGTAPEGL
jgi:imidazolonepropionase-like amidohydrolase